MPFISHCPTVQEATIISLHLFHCELQIHNGIYKFFLAYPRSNLITLFFLICQQNLIIPTALLLPHKSLISASKQFLLLSAEANPPALKVKLVSLHAKDNEPTPWIPLNSLYTKLLMQTVSPIPLTLGYFSFHST